MDHYLVIIVVTAWSISSYFFYQQDIGQTNDRLGDSNVFDVSYSEKLFNVHFPLNFLCYAPPA
jgi:hypothetical protein